MYSRLAPKHRLASWVRLVAATAAAPRARADGGHDRARKAQRQRPRGHGVGAARRSEPIRPPARPRRASWCTSSSTCTTADCASRCRCPARPPRRMPARSTTGEAPGPGGPGAMEVGIQLSQGGRGARARPGLWRRPVVGGPTRSSGRATTSAAMAGWRPSRRALPGLAHRLWSPMLAREEIHIAMSAPREFDLAGPLPEGVTDPRGERRNGQDLRHRHAGRAPCGRRAPARADAAGDVHAHGHRGVARTGARTPGRGRPRTHGGLAGGSPQRSDPVVALLSNRAAHGDRRSAGRDSSARSPTSTARPSPPRTASARRCSAGLGIAADLEPDAAFVEDVSDLVDEVLDDLYLRMRVFHRDDRPLFARSEALADRPRPRSRTRPRPSCRGPTDTGQAARAPGRRGPSRARRAQAPPGPDDLRRPAHPPPGRAGRARRGCGGRDACASATRSSSSTSSRTPTPCSGTSSGERSAPGRPSCSSPTPSRRSTRSAAPTCTPIWRPPSAAAQRATLAINRRSDQPLIDAFDALFGNAKLGHPDIAYRQVRATDDAQQSGLRGAPQAAAAAHPRARPPPRWHDRKGFCRRSGDTRADRP